MAFSTQVGRGLLNATLVQKFARHHQRSEIRVAGEAQGPIQGQGEIGCNEGHQWLPKPVGWVVTICFWGSTTQSCQPWIFLYPYSHHDLWGNTPRIFINHGWFIRGWHYIIHEREIPNHRPSWTLLLSVWNVGNPKSPIWSSLFPLNRWTGYNDKNPIFVSTCECSWFRTCGTPESWLISKVYWLMITFLTSTWLAGVSISHQNFVTPELDRVVYCHFSGYPQ